MSDSEVEEDELREAGKIRINVQHTTDDKPLQFVIRLTTPFKKVFNAFCDRKGVAVGTFVFHYDGQRLLERNCGESFDWKAGRTFDVSAMTTQEGGFAGACGNAGAESA